MLWITSTELLSNMKTQLVENLNVHLFLSAWINLKKSEPALTVRTVEFL